MVSYIIIRGELALLMFATLEKEDSLDKIYMDLHIFSYCVILTAIFLLIKDNISLMDWFSVHIYI